VFVSRGFLLEAGFVSARVRLVNLIRAGSLTPLSAAAWTCGLTTLPGLQVPRGTAATLSRVCLLEPVAGPGIVMLPLRWEAAGPVRVLNAGLSLTPAGPGQTLVRLDGMFRLPFTLARRLQARGMLTHRAAVACARLLLGGIADTLACPADPGLGGPGWGASDDDQGVFAGPRQRVLLGHDDERPPPGSPQMHEPELSPGGPGAWGA
jgi:hypothetical protein